MTQPTSEAIDLPEQVDASGAFPKILKRGRKKIFLRLLLNGFLQAATTIGLPFAILASSQLPILHATSLLAALAGAMIVLRIFELTDAERLGLDYVAEVRLALFDGLSAGTATTSHGIAMTRLMNDLSALKNWVGLGIARCVVGGFAFTGCIAAAATLSPLHAAAILAAAVPALLGALILIRPLRRRVGEVRRQRGKLASLLGEALLSLDMLRNLGQTARSRKRVRKKSLNLNASLARRMRIAATLRALPESILPFVVVGAIVLQIPLSTASIGLLLLAGLAIGPLRNTLRALEYRTAYDVARTRLASGLGTADTAKQDRPEVEPSRQGLRSYPGPVDDIWKKISQSALPVTSRTSLVRSSLRRNIDICRNFRGEDKHLTEIAEFCGLLDPAFAPNGLDTRLATDDTDVMTESFCARLELARALASGARSIAINAPALLLSAEGRDLLRALPGRFNVDVKLVVGDTQPIDLEPETNVYAFRG